MAACWNCPGGYADWLGWRARARRKQGQSRAHQSRTQQRHSVRAKPKEIGPELQGTEGTRRPARPHRRPRSRNRPTSPATVRPPPSTPTTRATALNTRGTEIDEELLELLARWEELEKKCSAGVPPARPPQGGLSARSPRGAGATLSIMSISTSSPDLLVSQIAAGEVVERPLPPSRNCWKTAWMPAAATSAWTWKKVASS